VVLLMMIFTIAVFLLAFGSIAVAIMQIMAARKEKKSIIHESQTKNGADPIKFRKALAKAFVFLGVFDFISASVSLLGETWFWPALAIFSAGGIVFLIMIRSAQKINPMLQR
jgi:protein-S-isoprenylcysteine O-methyltransferase Ste14